MGVQSGYSLTPERTKGIEAIKRQLDLVVHGRAPPGYRSNKQGEMVFF